jgi:protein ImuA
MSRGFLALAAVAANTARALPPLWRADQLDVSAATRQAARPTGHAALDAELPGGGWPASGLSELLLFAPGCGELRLLAPAMATGALLWIAPPLAPYAPALAALGIAADRLTVVAPDSSADAAWAAEQALRSGALSAVLWWGHEVCAYTPPATLRRLHLAAVEGQTPLFALRPAAVRAQSSPAPLRLMLRLEEEAGTHYFAKAQQPLAGIHHAPGSQHVAIDIFKRRGPPMATPIILTLPGPGPARCAAARRAPRAACVATRAAAASGNKPDARRCCGLHCT